MKATAKMQRRTSVRKRTERSVMRLAISDGLGHPRWVTADLLDSSEGGFGLALRVPLQPGSNVVVSGKLDKRVIDQLKVGVLWCREMTDGSFRAGLEFLDSRSSRTSAPETALTTNTEELDCYEVMQVSPNADSDTIARVYRILAQRYHPDNTKTGSSEMFVQLAEAHQILSHPEKRAKYDVRHRQAKQLHWKIFDQASSAMGSEGERRKRKGILALLYAKMLNDPEQAEMNIQVIEELLGCPREHLQAALWYLKGKNYIRRGDNGRYVITIAGFEEAEAQCPAPLPTHRQLPEGPQAG